MSDVDVVVGKNFLAKNQKRHKISHLVKKEKHWHQLSLPWISFNVKPWHQLSLP
jgi:hypothetical protein